MLKIYKHLSKAFELSSDASIVAGADLLNRYVKAGLGEKMSSLAKELTQSSDASFAAENRTYPFAIKMKR